MTHILQCQDVSHNFGKLPALSGVTLRVREGEVFGVIGPNGAGKTTLFNIISGAVCPDRGHISFRGNDITGLGSGRVCRLGIARTYQLVRPFPSLTVMENAMVGACFGRSSSLPRREAAACALDEVKFVGLAGRVDSPAESLTLAEKRLLEIARALATDPAVILLDEVVSGLIPRESARLLDVVRGIQARGITVIMIEHVMRAVMELCQSVCVLNFGRRIACGSPAEVVAHPEVIEAYLGPGESLPGGADA